MAISKVAIGATARIQDGAIAEIRVAAASLAPFPARLFKSEAVLVGQSLTPNLIETARQALLTEAQPIDDIRSNAQYRKVVGANLLEEFLRELNGEPKAR
jgi:xanthine dehydrogenase small subunit